MNKNYKLKKMKKLLLILGFVLPIIISCKKQGCTDPTAINYNEHAEKDDGSCNYDNEYPNRLPTIIDTDMTLTNDTIWTIAGRVSVTNGATLTIEPGTILKGASGSGSNACALVIARGGKINAQGTAEQPIIFTSIVDNIEVGQLSGTNLSEYDTGLWGGVLVLGNGHICAGAGDVISQIEGIPVSDNNGGYGGSIPDDNSGIMTYVSIRHGGANIGAGNEINGLSLGGVGSGTIINNIEVIANQDDGIEWFGGNVNVSNVIVGYTGDDGLDIDQSYAGTIENFYTVGIGDEDLEVDGPEGITHTNGMFTLINGSVERGDFRSDAQGSIINCNIQTLKVRASFESDCVTPKEDAAQHVIDGTLTFTQSNWGVLDIYTTGCSVPTTYQNQVESNMISTQSNIVEFDKSWTWMYINGKL